MDNAITQQYNLWPGGPAAKQRVVIEPSKWAGECGVNACARTRYNTTLYFDCRGDIACAHAAACGDQIRQTDQTKYGENPGRNFAPFVILNRPSVADIIRIVVQGDAMHVIALIRYLKTPF
jgi:hypothetical protein